MNTSRNAGDQRQRWRISAHEMKTVTRTFEASFAHIRREMLAFIPDLERSREKFFTQAGMLLQIGGPSARMLDLGCGHGFLAMIMSSLGWEVWGVDNLQDFNVNYDQEAAQRCREIDKLLWGHFGLHFIEHDINEALPLADATFDIVVLSDVLEHLHDSPKLLLEEAVRKLTEGGHLMIQTPNATNIKKRVKVLFGRTNYPPLDDWYFKGFPWVGHVREPTLSELKRILSHCALSSHSFGGCNYTSARQLPKAIRAFAAMCGRWFPSLSAHIYVVGQKTASHEAAS